MIHFFGCSGFHYDDWKDKFYPDDLPKKRWLEYYAEHFKTVEINNTFYHLPSDKTFRDWHERTPGNFRFTLKGSRYVTHVKKLNDPDEPVKNFYAKADLLKGKLGCILWQLPGKLKKNEGKIENFCKALDSGYHNAIEFRDKSWFTEEIYDILKHHKVAFCMVSAPGDLPESAVKTSGTVYLRFHGKRSWYDCDYTDEELRSWAKKLESLKSDRAYAYFNNDQHANAVKNCKRFTELVSV